VSQKQHTYVHLIIKITVLQYGRPNPDYNAIGEMVFGSVAISFRGTSFKVHWLQSPARSLCSQVFLAPVQPYSSTSSSSTNTHTSSSGNTHASSNYGSDLISEISGSISETTSLNSFSVSESAVKTNPLDVPTTALSLDNDDFKFFSQSMGDSSGYNSSDIWTQRYPYSSARSSLASIYSDIENHSRKMSISSSISEYPSCEFGHLNRRIMKNLSTSFENVSTITENMSNIIENNYYTVTGALHMCSQQNGLSDGCVNAKLRRNSEVVEPKRKTTSGDALSSNSSTLHHRTKRPRLAVAVCINMSACVENEMLIFCSEHMALLEQMIYRLRAAAENAYINRTHFLQVG
jgi:Folliculin-interacting protein N-terminus/Folliculin-interacting protein middle domain